MSLRLQSIFQDFADIGIAKSDLTADEIEALVYACARVDNPYEDINAELCEQPVKVCKGVYLWPVTAGAQIWLSEYAQKWWPKGSGMYRWAKVYALRNARDPDAFYRLTEKSAARRAVLFSALSLACHRSELAVAVNRCYGIHYHDVEDPHPKPSGQPEGQSTNFAHFAMMLEVHSGIPAKKWLFGRSIRRLVETYEKMGTLASAFGGAKAAEKMTFELNDALQNLANVKTRIVERIEAERKREQGT